MCVARARQLKRLRLPKDKAARKDGKPDARSLVVQLHDHFSYRGHLCLVFEPLGVNLLQLLQQNQCKGLSCSLIRYFSKQLLQVLALLREMGIVHCDLKPENILLQNLHSPAIKLIDFGSACYAARPMHTYIQSRFYRSPEVMLGLPYGPPIDMWSMGAIVGELFLGLPLFPGESEFNQMWRIVQMQGVPPAEMLEAAPLSKRFFECVPPPADVPAERTVDASPTDTLGGAAAGRWRLKSEERFCREHGGQPCRNKQYFKYSTLPELIAHHPPPKAAATDADAAVERERRSAMLHFCQGVLVLHAPTRWTPLQSLRHPFITGEPFTGTFTPPARDESATPATQPVSQPTKGAIGAQLKPSGTPCTLTISPASPPESAASNDTVADNGTAAANGNAAKPPASIGEAVAKASSNGAGGSLPTAAAASGVAPATNASAPPAGASSQPAAPAQPPAPAPPPPAASAQPSSSAQPSPPPAALQTLQRPSSYGHPCGQVLELSPPPPMRAAEKIGISVNCSGPSGGGAVGGGSGSSCGPPNGACASACCAQSTTHHQQPPHQPTHHQQHHQQQPALVQMGAVMYQAAPHQTSPPPAYPYHTGSPPGVYSSSPPGGYHYSSSPPVHYSSSPAVPYLGTFCASPPAALSPESMAVLAPLIGYGGASYGGASPPMGAPPMGYAQPPVHGHGGQMLFPSPGAAYPHHSMSPTGMPHGVHCAVSPPARCFMAMDGSTYIDASEHAMGGAGNAYPQVEYAASAASVDEHGNAYYAQPGYYAADGQSQVPTHYSTQVPTHYSADGQPGYYGADGQFYTAVAQPGYVAAAQQPYYGASPPGYGASPPGYGACACGPPPTRIAVMCGGGNGHHPPPADVAYGQPMGKGGGGGGMAINGRRPSGGGGRMARRSRSAGGPAGGLEPPKVDVAAPAASSASEPSSPHATPTDGGAGIGGADQPDAKGDKGLEMKFDEVFDAT